MDREKLRREIIEEDSRIRRGLAERLRAQTAIFSEVLKPVTKFDRRIAFEINKYISALQGELSALRDKLENVKQFGDQRLELNTGKVVAIWNEFVGYMQTYVTVDALPQRDFDSIYEKLKIDIVPIIDVILGNSVGLYNKLFDELDEIKASILSRFLTPVRFSLSEEEATSKMVKERLDILKREIGDDVRRLSKAQMRQLFNPDLASEIDRRIAEIRAEEMNGDPAIAQNLNKTLLNDIRNAIIRKAEFDARGITERVRLSNEDATFEEEKAAAPAGKDIDLSKFASVPTSIPGLRQGHKSLLAQYERLRDSGRSTTSLQPLIDKIIEYKTAAAERGVTLGANYPAAKRFEGEVGFRPPAMADTPLKAAEKAKEEAPRFAGIPASTLAWDEEEEGIPKPDEEEEEDYSDMPDLEPAEAPAGAEEGMSREERDYVVDKLVAERERGRFSKKKQQTLDRLITDFPFSDMSKENKRIIQSILSTK